jgi:hypothetical protein
MTNILPLKLLGHTVSVFINHLHGSQEPIQFDGLAETKIAYGVNSSSRKLYSAPVYRHNITSRRKSCLLHLTWKG